MQTRLERGLDYVLRNYGHDILLQRRMSDETYTNRLERHTVRHWYPASRGLPQTISEEMEGVINVVDMIYAFRADAKPKERDRIYERDSGLGKQAVFKIDYALPMRGLGGKVIYWLAGATREEPN